MKYHKLCSFLMLVIFVSGCVAPVISTVTPSVPAAIDTLSSTPTQFSTPSSATPTPFPSLRTDGPYLAYLRSQMDQIELVLLDADGKGRRLIPYPTNSTQPALSDMLSPDGKWLAYYTGSAGICFGSIGADTADLTLNLMSLSDGTTQVITKLLSQDYPNIFARAAQELNLPDISAEALQNAFVCGIDQSISWSPDGRYLAFAGQMDGLSSDLYIYDSTVHSINRLSSGLEEIQRISWSSDGTWIVDWSSTWVGEGMTYNVYATTVDGAVVKKLETDVHGNTRWLNDQSYFTYNNSNGIGNFGLSLVNIETGGITSVWEDEFGSFAASADRNWVLLYSQYSLNYLQTGTDPDLIPGLYLVNLTSMETSRVEVPDHSHIYESIQPLGSREVLFALIDATEKSLFYLSADGKLVPSGINAETLSVAPNQEYFVAVGELTHVLRSDGSAVREIAPAAGVTSEYPVSTLWRPDSSGLFFINESLHSPDSPTLYAMDLLAGDPVQVDMIIPVWWAPGFVWVAQPK